MAIPKRQNSHSPSFYFVFTKPAKCPLSFVGISATCCLSPEILHLLHAYRAPSFPTVLHDYPNLTSFSTKTLTLIPILSSSSSPLHLRMNFNVSTLRSNPISPPTNFKSNHTNFLNSKPISWIQNLSTSQFPIRPGTTLPNSTFQTFSPISAVDSITSGGNKVSVNPVYMPTPPDREVRTPHSGYHFDGSTRKFFEGWYFKVAIPERRESFCFMYSVENPAFKKALSTTQKLAQGPRFTGVGAQILGPGDKYLCQYSEESQYFWGSRHELMLGNTFTAAKDLPPPNREVPPQEFRNRVLEGFQVSPLWHQGVIQDDGRTTYAPIVKTARWEYSTRPVYGWGDVNSRQKATAGWLAVFPVFEPHWQICMATGLSTGWIEWDGELFEFENAPSYSEKNWGGGFPRKWFWVQCNIFQGADGEVALTVGGGLRELPGLKSFENAALVGIHYQGIFYEFVPWNGTVSWEIAPWGYWHVAAENRTHKVELEATTKDPGTTLRAPTMESGLAPACKDTCFGELRLQMWEKRYDGSNGKIILDVTSNMAALEVGGGPWFNTWKGQTSSPELLKQALNVPVDVEGLVGFVPFLKPPGL